MVILEGYGLSETSPVATFNHIDSERVPGSVGPGDHGRGSGDRRRRRPAAAAGEDGEIVVRGHNIMKGYYKRPEATAQAIRNGWFHTGDIGRRDANGNFFIVDRIKDMVIRGGFNVYPREIEEVLMTHPAIAMVAVIGVPHAVHGEEIKAFVVPRAGQADRSRGADRLVPRAHGGLQVSAHGRGRRGAADDRHRQDPQARVARLNRARCAVRRRGVARSSQRAFHG